MKSMKKSSIAYSLFTSVTFILAMYIMRTQKDEFSHISTLLLLACAIAMTIRAFKEKHIHTGIFFVFLWIMLLILLIFLIQFLFFPNSLGFKLL